MWSTEDWIYMGFAAWGSTGLMAFAQQVMAYRKERKRQRLMLKCDYWGCYGPAEHVWVEADDVHGLCSRHFDMEEQE